jgi:hypothetical protein
MGATGTARRTMRLAGAFGLLFAFAGGVTAQAGGETPREQASDLAVRNAILMRRLELARGDAPVDTRKPRKPSEGGNDFYLLLDPEAGRLYLMLRNAVLRDFRVQRLEQGVPEVVFHARRPDGEWQGVIYRGGQLDPSRELDRAVVVAPPPTKEGAESEAVVPPTPEEKYPVPSRYRVRFSGNLSLEVRTGDGDPSIGMRERWSQRLHHWWEDARSALGGGENPDTVRLRLVMAPDEARSLYRALPPDIKLLVLPRAS